MKRLLITLSLCLFGIAADAANLQKIVQDTQRMTHDSSRMTLVWWIPTEFWDETLRSNPNVTEAMRTHLTSVMNDYMAFAVVSADISPLGGFAPKDRATIEDNTQFTVSGKVIAPLVRDAIKPDALNFIGMMKPVMANMMGQLGQGIEFLLYPNPAEGLGKVSAMAPGQFSYTAFGNRYDWRLPIGSLLPPKLDAKTGEVFPGDYVFSPYTGEKLTVQPAPAAQ